MVTKFTKEELARMHTDIALIVIDILYDLEHLKQNKLKYAEVLQNAMKVIGELLDYSDYDKEDQAPGEFKKFRRVYCMTCGTVELSKEEYNKQMDDANVGWKCSCGTAAAWVGEFTPCYNPECTGEIQIDGDDVCSVCGQAGIDLFYTFVDKEDQNEA